METDIVIKSFEESIKTKKEFFTDANVALVVEAAETTVSCFAAGGKLLIAGNGGSAADAQHLAAEFVNRFVIERPPLPALALTTDSSILTSIGNDYSFDESISKQVKALGKSGDILLLISTSGNSGNIVKAADTARGMGIKTIALTGGGGGELGPIADLHLNVRSKSTARAQEVHITICHIICELVDHILFEKAGKSG
ncbi:MAG: SIS domain-containing protein [Thermodesulfobacteriota bacterium]